MNKEIEKLQEIIDDSENIVFSEEQEYLQRAIFRIFEVRTACISRNTKYSPEQIVSHTFFMRNTEGFFMNFTKKKMMFLDAKPNAAHKSWQNLSRQENLKQSLHRILTDFIRQQEVRMYMRSMEAFIAITVKNAENSTMQHM